MAETLEINKDLSRRERYEILLPQIKSLVSQESDMIANLANICAALRQSFGFFWVGFYINNGSELVLGPFQGDIACTRIAFNKGVCGKAYRDKVPVLVPDVNAFEGHIACSAASLSEIVLPALKEGEVALVLDIDSDKLNDFDEVDVEHLSRLMRLIEDKVL
ncbi:MAG: GAF domain-containing protein [Bernardetiaceae bacterium]|nr:GAF domain-containing protein [Bernardetiaceae bacterium]